jgi:flagellar protein FlbD
MIRLTRLGNQEAVLNSDLIESIEARPDTTIRLVTGQSLVVRESLEEVLARVRAWRASVLNGANLTGLVAQPPTPMTYLRGSIPPEEEADYAELELPA